MKVIVKNSGGINKEFQDVKDSTTINELVKKFSKGTGIEFSIEEVRIGSGILYVNEETTVGEIVKVRGNQISTKLSKMGLANGRWRGSKEPKPMQRGRQQELQKELRNLRSEQIIVFVRGKISTNDLKTLGRFRF